MASSSSYSFFFLIYFSFPTSQGLLSEEELAHLEQASAVATEVTSSIVRLKLEVEEKKRAISLLQTALVGGSASPACWGAKEKSPQHPLLGAEALEPRDHDGADWASHPCSGRAKSRGAPRAVGGAGGPGGAGSRSALSCC